MSNGNAQKFVHLDWGRGIASIVVVFHHFVLAFIPALKAPLMQGGLKHTPAYVLFNGTGAVAFFFALSGFVLSYGYFRRPCLQVLAGSVIKRLPRLMLPAGLSVLAGYMILRLLPPYFETAGLVTGSQWLVTFGNANFPANFEPGIMDALRQSLMMFLHGNDHYYNSNLWTMNLEFYGSMVVFFGLLLYSIGERSPLLIVSYLAIFSLWFAFFNLQFLPFLSGMALSYLVAARGVTIRLGRVSSAGLLAVALFGFMSDSWISCNLAALALMVVMLGNATLAERFSGKWSRRLGTLSFPLYLVHTLVLVSATSALFLVLRESGLGESLTLCICLGVTVVGGVAASLPFIIIEEKWVPLLNALTKRLTSRLFQQSVSRNKAAPAAGEEILVGDVGLEPTTR